MTYKVIALEFAVPTVLAVALAIVLSIGAVHLIDNYLGPIDQAEANYSAAGRDDFLNLVFLGCALLAKCKARPNPARPESSVP